MNNTLNSISYRVPWIQNESGDTHIKEDSIINFLQNSEIEFETCPKPKNKLDNFNTGFGENLDLHFKTKCSLPLLKTPLYQENYLKEFKTEEEKAAARHALGLYNKGDIVGMSLLTTKELLPSDVEWSEAIIKQMRLGDKFFLPITSFKAVYDNKGNTLDSHLKELHTLFVNQLKEILKITNISNNKEITSLGDIKVFLQGFNNGDNLHDTLAETLRFEKTGLIKN